MQTAVTPPAAAATGVSVQWWHPAITTHTPCDISAATAAAAAQQQQQQKRQQQKRQHQQQQEM